jgi:hypothetical protein
MTDASLSRLVSVGESVQLRGRASRVSPLARRLTDERLAHLHVCWLSAAGTFRAKAKQPFPSNAPVGEPIGLDEVGDGVRSIAYSRTLLGWIDARSGRIAGVEV